MATCKSLRTGLGYTEKAARANSTSRSESLVNKGFQADPHNMRVRSENLSGVATKQQLLIIFKSGVMMTTLLKSKRSNRTRQQAIFLCLFSGNHVFYGGSRELNTTPKGNKLRRLGSVVEARHPTKVVSLLTNIQGAVIMTCVASYTGETSAHTRALSTFTFQNQKIHALERDGEAWFIASEIAALAGYDKVNRISRLLDEDEKSSIVVNYTSKPDAHIVGISSENPVNQRRHVSIISESGLYHVAFNSRKPEMKAFRKWVTAVVLPAIRKTGKYAVQQPEARKTTTDERTGLRNAISTLVGKKGIPFHDAYHLVHQRFGVSSIDQLTLEQVAQAVEYIHQLLLSDTPLLPSPAKDVFTLTKDEAATVVWLFYEACRAADTLNSLVEPLRLLGSSYAQATAIRRNANIEKLTALHPTIKSILNQFPPEDTPRKKIFYAGQWDALHGQYRGTEIALRCLQQESSPTTKPELNSQQPLALPR